MNSKHLISSIILVLVLCGSVFILQENTSVYLPKFVYLVITILGIVSFILGEWISKAITQRPAVYVNRYMMSFLLKMMGFLIFLGTYVYLNPDNKLNVAMTLFVCYLIFNIHMIVFLKKNERKAKQKKSI